MPTRRNTLIGLGILTAGGTGAVATGAFSAATAERDVATSFAGDETAVLAFEPTSAYATLEDNNEQDEFGMLSISFDNLGVRSNFTFRDTFRIINNGTGTVQLTDINSGDTSANWNNEDENAEEPGRVLISNTPGEWQGDPNEDYISEDLSEVNGGAGTFSAGELGDEANETVLGPKEWVSIGFRFIGIGRSDDYSDEIPDTIRFVFESATDQ